MKTRILLCLIFTLAISCGPIYSTEYRYFPPDNSGGKHCVEQCEDLQQSCEELQGEKKARCEDRNTDLVDECNAKIVKEKQRGPKITECGRQISCDFPSSICGDNYRQCYRSCGGRVQEERVCVANCEK